MGPDMLYHNIANTSTVLADMGRAPVSVTSASRAAAAPRIPAKVYSKNPDRCSLTDGELQKLTAPNSAWSSLAPHTLKRRSVAWHAIVQTGGDWTMLRNAHLSTLAIPGSTIIKEATNRMYLVLAATNYGAVCVRVAYSDHTLKWSEHAKVEIVVLNSPREWKSVLWCPTPTTEPHGGTRVVMKPQETGRSLLTQCALRGFSHMSVAQVRCVAKWLRAEGSDTPSNLAQGSEMDLLRKVITHVLGKECTDERLKTALLQRTGVQHAGVEPSIPERTPMPDWDDAAMLEDGHDIDDD
eukprot:1121622-Amphidinium_carterae.1